MVLELLRLLLELRIGLLEFGLLKFEARSRLLQRSTLLFELLVRYPELFSLRLKLFGLTLRFFKKVLKLRTIVGGTNGNANSLRHLFEKGERVFIEGVDESELQHGVRRPVYDCRGDNQVPRLAFPERRTDGEIALRDVADEN